MRMCVSRLSICVPVQAGRKNVPPDIDLVPQAADQVGAPIVVRNHTRNGFAVLGDNQTLCIQLTQQCQALLLELGRTNRFHSDPP